MNTPTPDRDAPPPLAPAAGARVVLSTAPAGEAEGLAKALVDAGLAACVNVVPGVRSVYRWQGAVQNDAETLLIIKTAAERLPELAGRLLGLHAYEVPEFLVLAPEAGSSAYLAWLAAETRIGPEEGSLDSPANGP